MTFEYLLIILCWVFLGMVVALSIGLTVVIIEDYLIEKIETISPDVKEERF